MEFIGPLISFIVGLIIFIAVLSIASGVARLNRTMRAVGVALSRHNVEPIGDHSGICPVCKARRKAASGGPPHCKACEAATGMIVPLRLISS